MNPLSKHFNCYGLDLVTDSTIYLLHQLFLQVGWPTVLAAFLLLPTRVPSKRLRFCLRHHSNFPPKYSLIVKYFKPSHTFINTFQWYWVRLNTSQVSWGVIILQFDELYSWSVVSVTNFAQSMSKFLIYQLSEIRTSATYTQS